MWSKPSNPIGDDIIQSDTETVMYELFDAVEALATSGQENDANASHLDKENGATLSRDKNDNGQNSNLQHIDDSDDKDLVERLSDPGVNIVDDEDSVFEYSLFPISQDRFLRSSEPSDEITMNDVVVGLLYSSSGYNNGSLNDTLFSSMEDAPNLDDNTSTLEGGRNMDDHISSSLKDARSLDNNSSSSLEDAGNLDDTISLSLEDARNLDDNISSSLDDFRNLDDEDFLPCDPPAEVGDANEAAQLATEIEFLERLMAYFFEAALFDDPEHGSGDNEMEPE